MVTMTYTNLATLCLVVVVASYVVLADSVCEMVLISGKKGGDNSGTIVPAITTQQGCLDSCLDVNDCTGVTFLQNVCTILAQEDIVDEIGENIYIKECRTVILGDSYLFIAAMKELRADSQERINEMNEDNKDYIRELVAEIRNSSEHLVQRRIAEQENATQEELYGIKIELEQYLDTKFQEIQEQLKRSVDTMFNELREQARTNDLEAFNLNSTCPNDWTELSNKCVAAVQWEETTWLNANRKCGRGYGRNGKLVEIGEVLENFNIREMLFNNGEWRYCYWFGLADINDDNIFTLNFGKKPATYFHWKTGQPNGKKGTTTLKCACIGYDSSTDWVDEPCSNHNGYVCQIDKLPATVQANYTVKLRPS